MSDLGPIEYAQGPWVIDNRTLYDPEAGGMNRAPRQLGMVIAECPTAFGFITVRAPGTIGKPCPTKDELDEAGWAHARLCAAAPEMYEALKECKALLGGCWSGWEAAKERAETALAKAEGRE